MSVRWMAVQYLGNTLRLPLVNESDFDKPFGTSVLDRDTRRIVVNPYSENPVTFVPENENEKLRELFYEAWKWMQRARYDRSIRANEMDELGVKAVKLGFHDYELGIEASE